MDEEDEQDFKNLNILNIPFIHVKILLLLIYGLGEIDPNSPLDSPFGPAVK